VHGKIDVTSPIGTTKWTAGVAQNINFNVTGYIRKVNIFYSKNEGIDGYPIPVASNVDVVEGPKTVSWTPDPGLDIYSVDKARIKVQDATWGTVLGPSANFSLGRIEVTQPDGTQDLKVLTSGYKIQWNAQGVGNVNVYYSTQDGAAGTYNLIGSTAGSTGELDWPNTPATVSNTVRVKVVNANEQVDTAVIADDSVQLKLIDQFTITNIASTVICGDASSDPYNIQWSSVGTGVQQVKIEFFDGVSPTPLWSTITDNAGSYMWDVSHATSSNKCKIRITANNPLQPNTAKDSNEFWVHGKIDVTSPIGTTKWTAGVAQNINFNVTGYIRKVNIFYSKNEGIDGYPIPVASNVDVVEGPKTVSWTPDPGLDIYSVDKARIKVQDATWSTVLGPSANFSLGRIEVTEPDGTVDWLIKQNGVYTIRWNASGVSNFKVYYSTQDGAATTYNFIDSTTNNSLPWNTPDAVSNNVRIKVINANEQVDTAVIADVSERFKLIEQFSNIQPSSTSQPLTVNTSKTITWDRLGDSLGQVKIYLSTDNGGIYTFQKETENTGSASWDVPSTVRSTLCKIKIESSINDQNFGVSNLTFTIKNKITVTEPNLSTVPWNIGSDYYIRWTYEGPNQIPGTPPTPVKVKIEYSDTGNEADFALIPNAGDVSIGSGGTGSWQWHIADDTALCNKTGKIRVTDTGIDSATSTSTGNLTIRGDVVPNEIATPTLVIDDPLNLSWTLHGRIDEVNLYYSKDGPGGPWVAINDADHNGVPEPRIATDQPYPWTVPDIITDTFYIKVEDAGNTDVNNVTQNTVRIIGKIRLDAPDSSDEEDWVRGGVKRKVIFFPTGKFSVKIIGSTTAFADGDHNFNVGTIPSSEITSKTLKEVEYDVPDQLSDHVKIRVFDAEPTRSNLVKDESTEEFRIVGKLVVTKPVLNQPLEVHKQSTIEWLSYGSLLSQVNLAYSTSGSSGPWTTIQNGVNNSGDNQYTTHPWTPPPEALGGHVYIIVRDPSAEHQNVFDVSDEFKVKGWFEFTPTDKPALNDIWRILPASPHRIQWTNHGVIPRVKIEYTKNGTDFYPIDEVDNVGYYDWPPDADTNLSPTAQIRISEPGNPDNNDISSTFRLVGIVNLTKPRVVDHIYTIGDDLTIEWQVTGKIDNVHIDFSDNGGGDSFAHTISESIDSGKGAIATKVWNILNFPSPNVIVRVHDVNDSEAKAVTAPLHFVVAFDITSPIADWAWEVDSPQTITWDTTAGTCPEVKVELCKEGVCENLAGKDAQGQDKYVINTGQYPPEGFWNVWDRISTECQILISDKRDAEGKAESGIFRIRGGLELKTPNGGENLDVNTPYTITWIKHGSIDSVKLEYSIDSGGTYPSSPALPNNPIITGFDVTNCTDNCQHQWSVPNALSKKVRVKVTNENLADPYSDDSGADNVIRGRFTWSNPNTDGQVFEVGTTPIPKLTWTWVGNMPKINLSYSLNGVAYSPLKDKFGFDATGINNTGEFEWVVPNTFVSKNVYLKITDYNNTDTEKVFETVKVAGVLYLDEPNGSSRWQVGAAKEIKWHMNAPIANIKIEYSLNGLSGPWNPIPGGGSVDASLGKKDWIIPPNVTANAMIRISDYISDSGTAAVTSAPFNIVGSFAFLSPSSTEHEIWPVTNGEITNPKKQIQWSTFGIVPFVNLYYNPTGQAEDWRSINSTPIPDNGAGGTYDWVVPNTVSDNVRIRICDKDDEQYTYKDSPEFTIRGDLKITSPVGNANLALAEKWGVDSPQTIFWKTNGSIQEVYISYSKNGVGGPWLQIPYRLEPLTYAIPNGGAFPWTVPTSPDPMTNAARIKIENTFPVMDRRHVETISPENFKIIARFDVKDPDGGQHTVMAGQDYTIRWDKWGALCDSVKIELATNGDEPVPTYKTIVASAPNITTYLWRADALVPAVDNITPHARIRISDVNEAASANASDNPFIIRASFALDPAIGSEPLKVGEQYTIVWTKMGNIPQVLLQYSPGGDNFTFDKRNIVNNDPNDTTTLVLNSGDTPTTGKYIWTVPDIELNKADSVKLRVSDPNDPEAKSVSNEFRIIPKFTVTYPTGNADPNLTEKFKVGTPYVITWTSTSPRTQNVKITYTTSGGPPFTKAISTSWPNGVLEGDGLIHGSKEWKVVETGGVPDDISDQVKIRVEDATDPTAYDDSDYNLKIISDFTLSYPNGGSGVVYDVGDPLPAPIAWTNKGTVNNVELSYSTASTDFSSPVVIISPLNNGTDHHGTTYPWNAPNAIGTHVRVRVRSLTDDGFAISANDFRIRGKLRVDKPVDGEGVPIGQNYNIQWTSFGTIPNVDILYDTYDGKGYDGIAGTADDYWNMGADGVPGGSGPNADYLNILADDLANCIPTAPGITCSSSLTWTAVPAAAKTDRARIKIIDSRADNSDVIGVSSHFHVIGNVVLVEPNSADADWRVGTQRDVTWRWGGPIPRVKIFYTKELGDPQTIPPEKWIEIDPGVIKDYSTDGKGNGEGGVTRTYTLQVPNDISDTVRIKVQDYYDTSVNSVSANAFEIRGLITLTSPNGNADPALTDRWATQETRRISWNYSGDIPKVKIQYSNDEFQTDINDITTEEGIDNLGYYDWVVPDAVIKNPKTGLYSAPNFVKVRVFDRRDSEVAAESENAFKIDYYNVYFEVRDVLTGSHLSGLSLTAGSAEGMPFELAFSPMDPEGKIPLGSPVQQLYMPAGYWTGVWKKTSYADMPVVFDLNRDLTQDDDLWFPVEGQGMIHMETTALHMWRAYSDFSYKPEVTEQGITTPDSLSVSSWLERDGFMVSGGMHVKVSIYDGSAPLKDKSGNDVVLEAPGSIYAVGTNPDSAGFFHMLWENTTLEAGKVYTVVTDITNAAGSHFRTPDSFSITEAKKLQDVEDTVNWALDRPITEVEDRITQMIVGAPPVGKTAAEMADQLINQEGGMKGILTQKLDEQTGLIVGNPPPGVDIETHKQNILTAGGMVGMLQSSLTTFELQTTDAISDLRTGADTATKAGEKLKETALRYSWRATAAPDPALAGDNITIQVQGEPKLSPSLDIYSWDNNPIITNVIIPEIRPGFYSYVFNADSRFTVGKAYTFLVSEQKVTGGLVSGSGMVESMSISTVAGLAAAAPEAERAAKKALDAIKAVEAVLVSKENINIALTLKNLKESVDELPEILNKEGPNAQLVNAVNEISERIKTFVGKEGIDLSSLLDEKLGDAATMKDVRNKTDTINAIVDILLQIMESKFGGVDSPIISTSLQSGSVKFRIIALNPSKTRTQKIQVKKYLPQEIKPKDVMELGDLELEFDSEQSIYYVFKNDVELRPGEARVFEVEVEDIWMISQSRLSDIKNQTDTLLARFQNTQYLAKAEEVTAPIYPLLDEIARSQTDDSVSRERHIGIYRQNLGSVELIQKKLAELEKMLEPPKGVKTPDFLEKVRLKVNLPSKTTTWLIIMVIIIFLGLLAAIFFFVWQSQIRSSQNLIEVARKASFPEQKNEEPKK
jgi:hypothetical protein